MTKHPGQRPRAATFRFYAELNDFLPAHLAAEEICYRFAGTPSVKDAIEAQGIPHTEVELVLANGAPVDFHHRLCDGDRIAVYPVFESFDITPLVRLRESPLRHPRFVSDANLGKLARWFRLLGFDTLYSNQYPDAELASLACRECRTVLTRDRQLLHHKAITHGYWVRSDKPDEQVIEVLQRFQLERCVKPFSRCLDCNGRIHPVPKSSVSGSLEPGTRAHHDTFFQCSQCHRVYWRGSHYERMLARLERVLDSAAARSEPRLTV